MRTNDSHIFCKTETDHHQDTYSKVHHSALTSISPNPASAMPTIVPDMIAQVRVEEKNVFCDTPKGLWAGLAWSSAATKPHYHLTYTGRHKRKIQTSHKLGCPAKIVIREFVSFPAYKVNSCNCC